MNSEFELIAKTFQGLEQILAKELIELGANDIQIGRRMVSFSGDKELMYRANFHLRTALRILKPIKHFRARSADDVYDAVKSVDWTQYLTLETSFAVDSVVFSQEFRHSKFVAYKVKDAIVDFFRERTGQRPNISVTNPDLQLHIHIAEDDCTLSLDSSGTSLHRRGYRQESVEAPLNEVLAAGMILMTGWQADCDFIDPMCGSGTLPIEAALIARNIAPGVFRKEYAFEKWADFDQELFDKIYNDESAERPFEHKIYGFDNNRQAVEIATTNVKAAGLTREVSIELRDMHDFTQPTEKSLIVTNPPYGERISTPDLLGLYRTIGERLKYQFQGGEAWILSYREECFEQIGLKPSLKVPLYNGALECEFRKYLMFSGKLKDMRAMGGELKTDDERRQMAEKKRFKAHREFKRALDDQDEEGTAGYRVNGRHFDKEGDRYSRREEGGRERNRARFSRSDRDEDEGRRKNYLEDRHEGFHRTFNSKRRGEQEGDSAPRRADRPSGDRKPYSKPYGGGRKPAGKGNTPYNRNRKNNRYENED